MVSWFYGFMVLGLFHKLRTLVVNNSETISKDTLLNKWNRVRGQALAGITEEST
jgi:hypothetical protein